MLKIWFHQGDNEWQEGQLNISCHYEGYIYYEDGDKDESEPKHIKLKNCRMIVENKD